MLARITREITATEDIQAVLSSVATALQRYRDRLEGRAARSGAHRRYGRRG